MDYNTLSIQWYLIENESESEEKGNKLFFTEEY